MRIGDEESEPWEGIRIATRLRIAFDLLIGRLSLAQRVAYTDAWLRSGAVDVDELHELVSRRHDHGVRLGRQAMELVDPRAESIPESELRVLLRMAGFSPVPQLVVRAGTKFVARVDLGFEEERVAVEYDGAWHGETAQLTRDRQRLNDLQEAGWRVVSITAALLRKNPGWVVAAVRDALLQSRDYQRVLSP
ncbi:endonuclease domain-containing protein [Allokutzneria oryzae]|uniref:Endonuclease domain-containing protein n=1 Tax=Allokutzneria oryzae TaxID=1378989 RepID=A0ABV6ABV4_9PSEU